jgi:hypothetical protein
MEPIARCDDGSPAFLKSAAGPALILPARAPLTVLRQYDLLKTSNSEL